MKQLESVLTEYVALKAEVSQKVNRLAELKGVLVDAGEVRTAHYHSTVSTFTRSYLKNLQELKRRVDGRKLRGLIGETTITKLEVREIQED